jgi:excisionase family DNA binding protein
MTDPATDDLLSPAQASALIGVSVQTLRRYDREERLASVRTPGGQRRFRRSDVLALLAPPASPSEGGAA